MTILLTKRKTWIIGNHQLQFYFFKTCFTYLHKIGKFTNCYSFLILFNPIFYTSNGNFYLIFIHNFTLPFLTVRKSVRNNLCCFFLHTNTVSATPHPQNLDGKNISSTDKWSYIYNWQIIETYMNNYFNHIKWSKEHKPYTDFESVS